MNLKSKLATVAIIATLSMSAHSAPTVPAPKPSGGLHGVALNLAVTGILNAIGWVMDEGTKTNRIPDGDGSQADNSANAGSTAGGSTTSGSGANTSGVNPNQHGTYPLEYLYDGQTFTSAKEACNYVFGSYLTKLGRHKSRRRDGTKYEAVNVYLGSRHFNSAGYVACSVHSATNDDVTCKPYDICGTTNTYMVNIVYKGTERVETVTITDDYKKRREEARQAVEQAIAQAQASATTAPTTTDDNRVGVGTGTGVGVNTGTGIGVDTNVGTGTGVDTNVGTGTGTGTGTQTNTGTNTTTNTTTTTNTNTTTNTTTTNTTITQPKTDTKPFEMPTFCGWAKTVCDFMDWVKQEPTDKPQDIEIPQKEIVLKNPAEFDKRYIAVSSQCPADVVKDFDTGFKKEQVTISFEPICSTIYDYMRPVIIFLAYIGAIFVISSAFKIG